MFFRSTEAITSSVQSQNFGEHSFAVRAFSNGLAISASLFAFNGKSYGAVAVHDVSSPPEEPIDYCVCEGSALTAADLLTYPSREALDRWVGHLNQVCIHTDRAWVNIEDIAAAIG